MEKKDPYLPQENTNHYDIYMYIIYLFSISIILINILSKLERMNKLKGSVHTFFRTEKEVNIKWVTAIWFQHNCNKN